MSEPSPDTPFDWADFTARPTSAKAAYLQREFDDALRRGDAYLDALNLCSRSDDPNVRAVFHGAREMAKMLATNPETMIALMGFADRIEAQIDRCLGIIKPHDPREFYNL